jgi:hypothetical protein
MRFLVFSIIPPGDGLDKFILIDFCLNENAHIHEEHVPLSRAAMTCDMLLIRRPIRLKPNTAFPAVYLSAMGSAHMSSEEVARMDRMLKRHMSPNDILDKLRSARAKKGESGPSKDGVYRFINGDTYHRGREE